jgi:ubiquinone/menaquinone biosynthesis C-methylase UbiE
MTTSSKQDYFESEYKQSFRYPRNIDFYIRDKTIWRKTQSLLVNSQLVIDLAAGGGSLLYNIAQVTNAILIAIDFSRNALYRIKKIIPQVNVVQGDAVSIALSDEVCDFVVSTMFIEHVDDIAFLKEVYRILTPGGYFLVTTVLKREHAIYFYKNKDGKFALAPGHIREYPTEEVFLSLLKSWGFSIIESKTPRIKFSLIDPFLKLSLKIFKNKKIITLFTTPYVETFQKITRIPIPGFYAIEVLCKKRES